MCVRREATSASRLDNPNLMRVLDFGQEPDGLLYLAMEYLDGRDLLRILKDEGVPPPERIVDIIGQVLAALNGTCLSPRLQRGLYGISG